VPVGCISFVLPPLPGAGLFHLQGSGESPVALYPAVPVGGFCTRCLGFTNFVAKAPAGLASGELLILSGWGASFDGLIRSFRKVSPVSSFHELS
jgi:hypothetical protein